jgi:hypothetical protein
MQFLSHEQWTQCANTHETLVSPMADAFLQRRTVHKIHPVHDFLFTYYPFSPAKLKQWVPSFEEALQIKGKEDLRSFPDHWFELQNGTLQLNPNRLQGQALAMLPFIEQLCKNMLGKTARFGCFGLHEAMVYKLPPEQLRYTSHKLRLPPEKLARFVESQNLCCTHYDAYRFFTPPAKPLNIIKPDLETRLQNEQAGCLHANMDIYKWATKLWPWVGSDFIAKTFFLALEGRELDMRASPYDLQDHGYAPIRIETEEGRKEYQVYQQQLSQKAQTLRQELANVCGRLRKWRDRSKKLNTDTT